MIAQSIAGLDPAFAGYLIVLSGASLACLASIRRARRIEDRETRRGLIALLLTSAGWAATHVAYLLVPGATLKSAVYVIGLVVGFSMVGPWLYFCSAYTGRSLHRLTALRRLAVVVFLAIVAVKVTNPWHGLYFVTASATEPFPHLAVTHQPLHWIVMGLSYAMAAIGYFMLLERLLQVSYDTRPLVVLVGMTGLPLVLDLIGYATPLLVDITHEPIGVAIFAVGVCFVFLERFQAVTLAGGDDKPVIIANHRDQIREYNSAATALFPALSAPGTVGEPIWTVVPSVAEALETESAVLSLREDGETRYYQLSESPFAAGQSPAGRFILFTDITERERDRRELQRQNERLDQFASVVSHDLRNPLQVLRGSLDGARQTGEQAHFERGQQAIDRMETLIEDVLSLARQGQPIDETEPVSLASVAETCWGVIDAADATLEVADDVRFSADPERLRQLLENLYRNAVEHGSASPDSQAPDHGIPDAVTVRVGALPGGDGFFVEDDGRGIPPEERAEVFASGYSTADTGTGFGLAIVAEIVDAHGWESSITESNSGGARFEITEISTARRPAGNEAA